MLLENDKHYVTKISTLCIINIQIVLKFNRKSMHSSLQPLPTLLLVINSVFLLVSVS